MEADAALDDCELLNERQVATAVEVSIERFRQMVADGDAPAPLSDRPCWFRESITEWIENGVPVEGAR